MENTYLTAFHGMESIFNQVDNMLEKFNKKAYAAAFQEFAEKYEKVFQALEQGYVNAIEKDTYLNNMADALVGSAQNHLAGFTKKSAISNEKVNLNLTMVAYVIPALIKYKGTCTDIFVDLLLEKWKEQFPESNLTPGSYEEIESGFHRKFCYITTAVCESSGKPDDCYELTLLRDYRDHYLAETENGSELIREYYDVAPTIVKRINRDSQREKIYQSIFDEYINPCIRMIETGENAKCRELYISMVKELQERYFYIGDRS